MARRLIHDFEATWWRGKMLMKENGLIEPQYPLEPYNPFEAAYKPFRTGSRGEPRSILFELLKVNPQEPKEILNFCERFGVLGPSKELTSFDDLAEDEIEEGLESWTVGSHLKNKFGPISADKTPAVQPMSLEDFRKAHQDLTKAVNAAKTAANGKREEMEKARENLCRICNYKLLRFARPRLNWDPIQNRWRAGWHLGSLEAAIYLMLLFDVQSDGAIVTCPWCSQFFLSEHPRAKFCSNRCLNAHKQKQFREKQKQHPTEPKDSSRRSNVARSAGKGNR